jgi:lipopolysaccharide biosynthesis glycosyltransferase
MKTALVLGCDDYFIAYASVVAHRTARLSSEKFPIIIVSDGVSDENKRLAQKFCPQIGFIEAGSFFMSHEFHTTEYFSRATYLRLFLDEILADFDRITYIDSDMSPLVDLSPLLRMVPKASPVMATYGFDQASGRVSHKLPLSPDAGYLQGGLQIFDLKAVREERIFKDAIRFALENPDKCDLVDQDALNAVLQGRWQVIDWRWNVLNVDARYFPRPFNIRHHGGPSKPWATDKTECEPYIVKEWRKDLAESPWPQKFLPSKRRPFLRTYVRPVTHAMEVPLKAAFRGDLETIFYGEESARKMKRFRERLPLMLKKAEEAAREGRLASAL